jgi:Tat protein translocase TatB subunit
MFDLGIQELILIFVVALVVFGPKRLPEIAHALGKGVAEMKKALSGVKDQIDAELSDVKDIKELKDLKKFDPIELKNELFKDEDLFKVNEPPKAQPQPKVDDKPEGKAQEPQKTDEEKSDKSTDQSDRKVQG